MKLSRGNYKQILKGVIVFRHLSVFMSIIPILGILHIAEGHADSETLLEILVFLRYVFWGYWIAEVILIFCLKHSTYVYGDSHIETGL